MESYIGVKKIDGFIPICPKGIYNFQIRAMGDYIACLEIRAKIEGITLPEVNV